MTIKEFKQDKILFYPFLASIGLILIALIRAVIGLVKVNNLLILHFDSYKGIDFLGNKSDVFSIIGLAFVIIIINFILAKKIYYKERFLAYLLSIASPIFSLLILIGVFVIISVN